MDADLNKIPMRGLRPLCHSAKNLQIMEHSLFIQDPRFCEDDKGECLRDANGYGRLFI